MIVTYVNRGEPVQVPSINACMHASLCIAMHESSPLTCPLLSGLVCLSDIQHMPYRFPAGADLKQHQTGCVAVQAHLSLVRSLAALWGLNEDQVQQYTVLNKPSMHISPADVSIGRAVLPKLASTSAQPGLTTPASSNKVRYTTQHIFSLYLLYDTN